MNDPKRVLIVSYLFPPSSAVGALRFLKFAKFLPQYGWKPIMLTATPDYFAQTSAQAEAMIPPGLEIHRVKMWPGPRQIYLKIRGKSGQELAKNQATFAHTAKMGTREGQGGESLPAKVKRWLLALTWLPDDIQGWYPPASRAGIRLFKETGFDAIVSTGPPWTPHWVARRIALATGRPWLADFRDPWTLNTWKGRWVVSEATRQLEVWMENQVMHRSARVICNTDPLSDRYRERYPDLAPERFVTITNGFDPDDYGDLPLDLAGGSKDDMTLAYAGNLYGDRDPGPLFQALKELRSEADAEISRCRIVFIGTTAEDRIRSQAKETGIAETVEFIPPVSRGECLQRLAKADVLLLMQPGAELQIPAKLFEYLQLRKPILTLAGEGATRRMVESAGAGIAVAPGDVAAIRETLKSLAGWHKTGALAGRFAARNLEALNFSSLTGRLADLLNEVAFSQKRA